MVFGPCFYYTNCQQYRGGHATVLNQLEDGSLILFGSHSGGKFLFDTVFVTKKVGHITADGKVHFNEGESIPKDSPAWRANLKPLLQGMTKPGCSSTDHVKKPKGGCTPAKTCVDGNGHPLTLYRGVQYKERHKNQGIFSFSPCRREGEKPFNRIELSNNTGINPQLRQGFKKLNGDPASIFVKVITAVHAQGCYAGFEFDL